MTRPIPGFTSHSQVSPEGLSCPRGLVAKNNHHGQRWTDPPNRDRAAPEARSGPSFLVVV
jgi:hypothetical protein